MTKCPSKNVTYPPKKRNPRFFKSEKGYVFEGVRLLIFDGAFSQNHQQNKGSRARC